MKTAIVFPGQGSQKVGMGKALYDAHPVVAALFRQTDEILGRPLSRLIFEGPEEELTRTENSQPALFLVGYAFYQVWQKENAAPVAAAGHSLGEYTALASAGVFSFEDALRLVQERGRLMARAGQEQAGGMLAVLGLENYRVEEACRQVENVWPANYNAPGQVVVSGAKEALGRFAGLLREKYAGKSIPLKVSGAFHSPLMSAARDGLEKRLSEVNINQPVFPVYANVTAAPYRVTEVKTLLVEQIISPVRWMETVEQIRRNQNPEMFREAEPARVLSGLIRRIIPDAVIDG